MYAARGRKGLAIGAIALAFASALAVAWPSAVAAAPEWRIESAETIENTTYLAQGPIVVAQGGQLTIRNATLAFNQTIEGGLKLDILAGGSVIIFNSTLRSSDEARALGLHWNFLVAGHLEAHGADISDLRGDPGEGGIVASSGDVLIEDSSIHNNRYYGIMLRSGTATVRNTTFDGNAVAVFVTPGASPRLDGLFIRNSTTFGLKVSDATPVVRNLTVEGTQGTGVGWNGGVLDLQGCRISGMDIGLDLVGGTTGSVEFCEFLSLGTGVRAQGAPVLVADSTFLSVGTGVNATSSAVVVTRNAFADVGVGVRVSGVQAVGSVGEGTSNNFTGNGVGFEVYVPSFFLEGNTYGPLMTGSRVFHNMELQIMEEGGAPAVRAKVEIHAADGSAAFTGLTDDQGAVQVVLEEFREHPNGTRQNMTPHSVRIETGGRVTVTQLNATSDRTEQITLAKTPAATLGGVSREGLLLIGLLIAGVAAAGAVGMAVRRRRAAKAASDRRTSGGRRRGPRSGR